MSKKKNTAKQPASKQPASKRPASQPPKRSGNHAVRRRVRFDRIAIVAVPLLLIIILIAALCVRSLQKSGKLQLNFGEESSEATASQTLPPATESTTPTATSTTAQTEESASEQKEITLSANDVAKGNLIVVDRAHDYTFPTGDPELQYVHEGRVSAYTVSDLDVQLDTETLEQLNQMMTDYEAASGYSGMQVFSGYRSKSDQDSRYESGSSNMPGGSSDYHTGRSFNLKIDFGDGTSDYYNAEKYPDYSWIAEHAAEYGFVVRYPEGKDDLTGDESRTYTFRYVGVPHAVYMTEHDLCLEEYVELVQDYTADEPLMIETEDGSYAVYYAAAEGSSVHVPVRSESYTVSGDNIGGFILTCKEAE